MGPMEGTVLGPGGETILSLQGANTSQSRLGTLQDGLLRASRLRGISSPFGFRLWFLHRGAAIRGLALLRTPRRGIHSGQKGWHGRGKNELIPTRGWQYRTVPDT